MQISLADIEAAKTERGGWTKSTLARWGISWPPPKGWKDALLAGEKVGFTPQVEPESSPDSVEAKLLHGVMMAVINAGQGDILNDVKGLAAFSGGELPTVADIVGGRPDMAIIEGGITLDDKVYRFSVAQQVKP